MHVNERALLLPAFVWFLYLHILALVLAHCCHWHHLFLAKRVFATKLVALREAVKNVYRTLNYLNCRHGGATSMPISALTLA